MDEEKLDQLNLDEEKLDPLELQLETVKNREMYMSAIERLYQKQLKYRLRALDNQASAKVDCKIPQVAEIMAEIKFPAAATESDLEKKMRQLLINDVKKHLFALEIINKSKNCPVSQLMDKL